MQPTPALFGCGDKRPPDQRTQSSEAPCGGVLPFVANVRTQSTSLPHAGCASLTSTLQPASPQQQQHVSAKSIKLPGLAACQQFEALTYPLGLACPFCIPKLPNGSGFGSTQSEGRSGFHLMHQQICNFGWQTDLQHICFIWQVCHRALPDHHFVCTFLNLISSEPCRPLHASQHADCINLNTPCDT